MASVTTYSSISSRRIVSSVWSTLMTSSIWRRMLLANRDSIAAFVISWASSEDLRSVVVFGVQDAHEAKAGSAVERPRVEEDRRDPDAALELL
jgi:hypothetical protein